MVVASIFPDQARATNSVALEVPNLVVSDRPGNSATVFGVI